MSAPPYYIKNFGYGTLNGSINSVTTSMVVNSGNNFSLLSTDFFKLIIWDAVTYPNPADDPNLEVVTAHYAGSLNHYTIARAQEGTVGVSHASGSACAMTITAGLIYDDLNALSSGRLLFIYEGSIQAFDIKSSGTTLINAPATGTNYEYLVGASGGSAVKYLGKFKKTPFINIASGSLKLWIATTGGGRNAQATITIGSLTTTAIGPASTSTPTEFTWSLDISSLTNGNIYDAYVTITDNMGSGNSTVPLCAEVVGFGSQT